jgi:hypothetical protein
MEVRLKDPNGREIPNVGVVEGGETIEVDDELGESLILQEDVWEAADGGGSRVRDILDDVGDDPDKARQALALEREADKPRKSLISRLEGIANPEGES